jgi:hypothetical protein
MTSSWTLSHNDIKYTIANIQSIINYMDTGLEYKRGAEDLDLNLHQCENLKSHQAHISMSGIHLYIGFQEMVRKSGVTIKESTE